MPCSAGDRHIRRRARPVFGTFLVLKMTGVTDGGAADGAFDRAFGLAQRFHQAMSRQDPDSDLSAIARARPGEKVDVRPETMEVLRFSLAISEDSAGRFDPVVRRGRARAANWRDVILSAGGSVSVRRSLSLSLDGVAKGFAADRLRALLREAGDGDVVVDAGGDIALSASSPQAVHIRDVRRRGGKERHVFLSQGGIAGSGPSGTKTWYWDQDGRRVRTRSITVVAPSCAVADAMTKVGLADPHPAVLVRWGARIV